MRWKVQLAVRCNWTKRSASAWLRSSLVKKKLLHCFMIDHLQTVLPISASNSSMKKAYWAPSQSNSRPWLLIRRQQPMRTSTKCWHPSGLKWIRALLATTMIQVKKIWMKKRCMAAWKWSRWIVTCPRGHRTTLHRWTKGPEIMLPLEIYLRLKIYRQPTIRLLNCIMIRKNSMIKVGS